jgi:hypothetical protein
VRLHQDGGQVYVVASDSPEPKVLRPPQWTAVHPSVLPGVKAAFANVIELPSDLGQVLTDDFNPVEFYDARNRELVRRQLVRQSQRW